MSRRDRRAALARGKAESTANPTELAARATFAFQEGRAIDAEVLCKQILALDARQPTALNIMGLLYQASGNHRLAAKTLAKAVAANELDAACQYNLAASYQALGQRADAARHYRKALALGLSGKGPEPFLLQDATIIRCLSRMEDRSSLPVRNENLFGAGEITAVAENTFLRCALGSTIIRGVPLEAFLTGLRHALLRLADYSAAGSIALQDDMLGLFCALAEQCFLNEYRSCCRNRSFAPAIASFSACNFPAAEQHVAAAGGATLLASASPARIPAIKSFLNEEGFAAQRAPEQFASFFNSSIARVASGIISPYCWKSSGAGRDSCGKKLY
jgi:hypothetical protein